MKTAKLPSLVLALVLQVLPVTRVFLATSPATGSSFAIVSIWMAGLAALLGSYDTVSGASTTITSSGTATGTNGVAFSYRITTGPDTANRFSAVPLPLGLTCSTTTGRITGTPTEEGIFTVLLTASDNGSASRTVTKNLALTIRSAGSPTNPPSISTQPTSRTVTNGGNTTFTVVASGSATLRYQWRTNGVAFAGATNSTLTLTSVTTNDTGSYTVVITNSVGSVTSNPALLTVTPAPVAPTITTQPASLTVMAGSNASFTVAADGTAPLRYQWRRNNGNLSGSTNTTFTIASAQPANAGDYTVIVSNAGGAVTSAVATLTVNTPPVPDTVRPTLKILLPSATFTRVLSNSVTFRGTALDDQSVTSVEVQQGTNDFTTASGTTNWTFNLPLAPGTNVLRVRAADASGNLSLTNTRTVFFAVMTPLTLSTNGNGAVSSLTNNQLLELGKSYTLKATPKPGNLFSNWIVGGQAMAGPTLSFVMSSNLAVVANFVPNPFLGLKGAYSGLFHPVTSEPPHEQSGYFTLAVTDKGTYSGKLLLNGGNFSVSGTFGLDLSVQKTVLRRGTNDLTVGFQLSSGLDQITGYVSNVLWVSELFGYRTAFNSKTNPATNSLGKYTMLLSGSDDATRSPLGLGSASLAVASSGGVTIKGTLADGTAGAQKGALAANGQLPVYVNLYRGKGSLFGWLTFTNTATNDIPGLLLWTRKEGVIGNFYPGGFTNEVLTLASRYTPTAKGTAVVGFSNSVAVLEGGNLAGPQTNDVFLNRLNKITVTSTNTDKLALALTSSSGLLSGSFVHPQTLKKSTIKGVVLQKQNLGGGFFLGTNQSGSVSLGRPEDLPVFRP